MNQCIVRHVKIMSVAVQWAVVRSVACQPQCLRKMIGDIRNFCYNQIRNMMEKQGWKKSGRGRRTPGFLRKGEME